MRLEALFVIRHIQLVYYVDSEYLSIAIQFSEVKMYKPIADCYEGQSVFITGATGFLGKVLLEKLLYSCPGINKIYILIREKANASIEERLQMIFEQPIFNRIKSENPQALMKIVPISGDVSLPGLGIKVEDKHLLIDTVSRVFHLAATVKFNEPLNITLNINVHGTEHILSLCKNMKNIKSFVYVSTAFSNADKKIIEETTYPMSKTLSEIKSLIDNGLNENQVKELLGGKPNNYTFTKAITENYIVESHGDVPVVIVRPSIVSPSISEPLPGWIDNWFGATPLILGAGKGYNRVVHTSGDNTLNLIPVDYVSNAIIVAAATCKGTKDVAVYNSCSSRRNPLRMQKLADLTIADSYKNKFYDIPLPFIRFTTSKLIVFLITLFMETIPAYIADFFMLVMGKKCRYVKAVGKLVVIREILHFFITNSLIIKSQKTRNLAESLSPSDKLIFPFNPIDIDWDDYIPIYCHGIREFLLKK